MEDQARNPAWLIVSGRGQSDRSLELAKLYFSYSTIKAGKSTLLLQASCNYRERGMRTVLFIAAFDDRAGVGRIASRIGLECEATPLTPQDDLFAAIRMLREGVRSPAPLSMKPSS